MQNLQYQQFVLVHLLLMRFACENFTIPSSDFETQRAAIIIWDHN